MRIETDRLIIRSVERGDEMVYADMAKDGSLLDVNDAKEELYRFYEITA